VTVLAGAFDPPTRAHLTLAHAVLRAGAGAFLFSLAVRTIDKEASAVAGVAPRLDMLGALAARRRHVGVVVCNRGLYVDQAQALGDLGFRRPRFAIGIDKVPQLFDARYYRDRDAALRRLFELASFLVVPRGGAGAEELARFMALPAQRDYLGVIEMLPLTAREEQAMRDVSSTHVRALLAQHGKWQPLVPREIWNLVQRSGAYQGVLD